MLSTGLLHLLPLAAMLISPAAANPQGVALQTWPGDKYSWRNSDESTRPWSPAHIKAWAKEAYNKMKVDAKGSKMDLPEYMAVVHSYGHGVIYASSIRGGGTALGKGTKELVSQREPGNCAEMHALAMANTNGWPMGTGSKIAVYGKNGFVAPCTGAGAAKTTCQRALTAKGVRDVRKGKRDESEDEETFVERDIPVEFEA